MVIIFLRNNSYRNYGDGSGILKIHYYSDENAFIHFLFKDIKQNFSDKSLELTGIDYFLYLRELISKRRKISFQIVKEDIIFSTNNLKNALMHVNKAFNSNLNISNNYEVELLLYLSLKRHIEQAIGKIGVNFEKKQDEVSKFSFVIFGNQNYIREAFDEFNREIEFSIEEDILENYSQIQKLLQFYEIDDFIIHQQYHLEHPDTYPLVHKDISQKQIEQIPIHSLIRVLEEILNQKMELFYLENFKWRTKNANSF